MRVFKRVAEIAGETVVFGSAWHNRSTVGWR